VAPWLFLWSKCGIVEVVDASSQPGDLLLPLSLTEGPAASTRQMPLFPGAPAGLVEELWHSAEAESCDLPLEEFGAALSAMGTRLNCGQPAGAQPDTAQQIAFFRSLHLAEFALAQACSFGIEVAWERFVEKYRGPLTHAATAITGSATLGHDLADSLYAELYGLRQTGDERRSPLASYTGRGSLLGWLRATLGQRFVDHHRRTRRETPIETLTGPLEIPAPVAPVTPMEGEIERLTQAVARTLSALPPEDRFVLSAYFLDRQTLQQIGRLLRVHEATISRRLKRLATDLRNQLLVNLQADGLSERAAEEALGADPRDIEINLRALLQTSQIAAFKDKTALAESTVSDKL
jgi:RNA polymerase sigma-70 factor (ECF subfamily)